MSGSEAEVLFPRRNLLGGGLAGLAAALMTRTLPGCGGDGSGVSDSDAGIGDGSMVDTGVADAVDAGAVDAGAVDAGAADAGAVDAGAADVRAADAGAADAGAADVRTADAGAADVRTADAGAIDARVTDASAIDARVTDASAIDARVTDAGVTDAALTYFEPRVVPAPPALRSLIGAIGPLRAADANGLRLPAGFTSRVVARSGERVAGTAYSWHSFPDGGATYATEDGGWIYASNSEASLVGGVGAVRFAASGAIVSAYRILAGTSMNCAGCQTPWHTWLSCEEVARGRVFECDPYGDRVAVARPALGLFRHEAAAVDPENAHVYLTEDEVDGRLYRFVPAQRTPQGHPDLSAGRLQAATVDGAGRVTWREVPDPRWAGATPTRLQVPGSTAFNGGEGIWYHAGVVYFSTKGTNQVWAYRVRDATLTVLYDDRGMASPPIRGVDNLTVSCCGDVLVAEDPGAMQIVAILPGGGFRPLVQVVGHDGSEVTGPAFDPSGTRLYFSSQRGTNGGGVGRTFEVRGPFHARIG